MDALFSWSDPIPFMLDLRHAASEFVSGAKPKHVQAAATAQKTASREIDYDIHGFVGIRLVDASPDDAQAVRRQLGPLQLRLSRPPDILVRFVKSLPTDGLRYVEVDASGFTNDGFFILRNSKRPTKVKIGFQQIGKRCEIVCQTGLRAVPLLMAIVNLTLLAKGCVSLHASAFVHEGKGVLVTGWSKGGKTEALLAFAKHGARYVGDEWIILTSDGQRMYGLPENIRLWEWHLDNMPGLPRQVRWQDRLLFRLIHILDGTQKRIPSLLKKLPVLRLLTRAIPGLKRQLNVCLQPEAIFGEKMGPFEAKPEKLFFLLSDSGTTVRTESADAMAIADRMSYSVQYEQASFMEDYQSFKFAFPALTSNLVDRSALLQRLILRQALAGKEAYTVRHPYPVSFEQLYEAMRPLVEQTTRTFSPAQVASEVRRWSSAAIQF